MTNQQARNYRTSVGPIATLAQNVQNHKAGDKVVILNTVRAGLYRVQFSNGDTCVIGRSSLR